MKKYIVLSVNDNPDYLYFTPLTCWAWRKFGWEPIVMYHGLFNDQVDLIFDTFERLHKGMTAEMKSYYSLKIPTVGKIDGYRSDTITQISRLYAVDSSVKLAFNDYLMTGDIDMIPLSDYWKPVEDEITVWGHDLTGFGHYPICYIGMQADVWKNVMSLTGHTETDIKRDLDTLPQAKDPDFYKYWFTDQDLITKRLKPFNPTLINRGQYSNGYARGRVDRGSWSLNHSEFVDAHLFQQLYFKQNQDKFDKTMELLTSIWPEEDFGWFLLYTEKFRNLCGNP